MAATEAKASVMSHPVVVTFLIMAIVGAMSLAAEVLKPLALSVLLSFALTPLARLLERRARLPRAAAVVLTVVLALGTLGGIGYVVDEQLDVLAERLPGYQANIEKKLQILSRTGIGIQKTARWRATWPRSSTPRRPTDGRARRKPCRHRRPESEAPRRGRRDGKAVEGRSTSGSCSSRRSASGSRRRSARTWSSSASGASC